MTKPRAVTSRDGRIGFPDIVSYETAEGPCKGEMRAVPPTHESDPYIGGHPYQKASVAYRLLVHDQAEYDRLRLAGFWASAEHRGKSVMLDGRATA